MFESLEALIADERPTRLVHPLLNDSTPTSIYAAESRVFIHTRGNAAHVLEVLTDHRAIGLSQTPTLQIVDDLEGLGNLTIVPGSSNRLAVVTEAGDAYLFSKGSKRPELLVLKDEDAQVTIRMIGLGSEFEAVVTDDNVWVRGDSECSHTPKIFVDSLDGFGQLGIKDQAKVEEFTRHPFFSGDHEAKRVVQIVSSRWSTLMILDDT